MSTSEPSDRGGTCPVQQPKSPVPPIPGRYVMIPTSILAARTTQNLSADAILIYALLVAHAWDTDECSVGEARLVLQGGYTVEQVRQALADLENAGHIQRNGRRIRLLTIVQRQARSIPPAMEPSSGANAEDDPIDF